MVNTVPREESINEIIGVLQSTQEQSPTDVALAISKLLTMKRQPKANKRTIVCITQDIQIMIKNKGYLCLLISIFHVSTIYIVLQPLRIQALKILQSESGKEKFDGQVIKTEIPYEHLSGCLVGCLGHLRLSAVPFTHTIGKCRLVCLAHLVTMRLTIDCVLE